MRITRPYAVLLLTLMSSFMLAADGPSIPPPPPTRKVPVTETLHGVTITDPYRWLEDQDSPETRQWIDAQNAYTHSVIDKLPGRDAVSERLSQLLKTDSINVPRERNGKLVYTERKADEDLYVVHLRDASGKDEVLIDPHPLSPDHTTSVSIMEFTHDGSLLAYGIRRGGADEVEVHVKDVNSKQDLSDVLPKARYFGISFLPDKSGFFYSTMLKTGPRIRFHKLGSDAQQDEEIFGERLDPTNIAAAQVTDDGKFLLIEVQHGSAADKSELYVQDLANHGPIKPIVNDIPARFQATLGGDTAYTLTNWNAPNGKIIAIDLNDSARDKWRDVVPESADAIDGFDVAGGKVVVGYLHNVTSQLKVFTPDGKQAGTIALPSLGTAGNLRGYWDSDNLYYQFSSFPTPATIYRYDVTKGKSDEWARVKVPVESNKFEVKQVWYESKDKTRVPMFLVYRKGLQLNGSNPTLMTGYGGFNLSRTPEFSALAIYWAERGGVYALPNLRGGGEFGEKWHHAGMLEKKQNVFDDFISAGEWLVKDKYTNPQKLAILGGSNGGLLVGAALTQHPELFRAVICSYPLLDMVRYHQFLVARFWVPEYGSAEDPQQFKVLYAYSPYHHVKQGTKYPAVMLLSGDSDTRVAPLHARKMTALLQASNGGPNPVMLHYDTKSGHSEGRPVTKVISDTTDELSFLFWQLGAEQNGNAGGSTRASKR